MIIAVCTPLADANSRSLRTAAVLDVMQRSAQSDPAPDLIVLPDCTAGEDEGLGGAVPSAAMSTGYIEIMARGAREWGVWIAAGHPRHDTEGMLRAATLFDPDGDPWLRYPKRGASLCADKMPPQPMAQWKIRWTPWGRWALTTADLLSADADLGLIAGGVQLAVVLAGVDDVLPEVERFQAAARAVGCPLCVVQPRSLDRGEVKVTGCGLVIDKSGEVCASTAESSAGIASAELSLAHGMPQPMMEELTEGE